MKVGDLVVHEYECWGKGMIVQQQGVMDRWFVRWFNTSNILRADGLTICWGHQLEVLSESR